MNETFIGKIKEGQFDKGRAVRKLFVENDGKEVAVTIQEPKDIRTLQQNKYFHKCCSILGNEIGYTVEEMKVILKKEFGMYDEVHDKKTGEVLINWKSTADLTKKDFAELTENLLRFAAEQGVVIQTPEEFFKGSF